MYSRIVFMSRGDQWPWLTPLTVWRLPFFVWVAYARQADAEIKAINEANAQAKARR